MSPIKRNLWLLFAMLICAGAAFGLTPRHKISELNPLPQLENSIPTEFGQWRTVPGSNQVIDPNQKTTLTRIYDQTLSRTYENRQGYRIMLSMAYGGNQRDELELHKPEVCYVAQGFVLNEKSRTQLQISAKTIPVTRLNLTQGNRIEPVTYWATVGDTVINDGYSKKLVEIRYGLAGQIPDGILVRISSIDDNQAYAYSLHEQFANEFLAALPTAIKVKLLGGH
jgi:EpsI family protein